MSIKRPAPSALFKASWYLRQYNAGEGDGLSSDLIKVADWLDQMQAQAALVRKAQSNGKLGSCRRANVIPLHALDDTGS